MVQYVWRVVVWWPRRHIPDTAIGEACHTARDESSKGRDIVAEEMVAHAQLAGGMRFEAETGSGHRVVMDAKAEEGGTNAGSRPMEMLLVALAGCIGMDVISILRKKRQDVTAYEVRVHAERANEHPRVFTEITVQHIVTGHHVDPVAVARAIELSEKTYCGAGAMLGKTAKLSHVYRILNAPE